MFDFSREFKIQVLQDAFTGLGFLLRATRGDFFSRAFRRS